MAIRVPCVGRHGRSLLGHLSEDRRGKAQEAGFVREQGRDACASLELAAEAFEEVARSHPAAMGWGEVENGEALGQVLLHPGGETRR